VGREVLSRMRSRWRRRTMKEPFPGGKDMRFELVVDMVLMVVLVVVRDCGDIVLSEVTIVVVGSMGGRGNIDRLG
jgi:hypothetical protein